MKYLILSILTVSIVMFATSDALACSCAPLPAPDIEMREVSAVFAGRVVSIKRHKSPFPPHLEVILTIDKQWKGAEKNRMVVFTASNGSMCGFGFRKDVSYLVYADANDDGTFSTSLCSRTAELSDAESDIRELDRIRSSSTSKLGEMPGWLTEHFGFMTAGSGRWVTDNSKFKTDAEPFDQYGTEWKWGIGKTSIKGRLFGLRDGNEVEELWEYLVFWQPRLNKAVFQQFGGGGVVGIGELMIGHGGPSKRELSTEMIFYSPNGASWSDRHELTEGVDVHTTQSFRQKDRVWESRRTYVWRRAKP